VGRQTANMQHKAASSSLLPQWHLGSWG